QGPAADIGAVEADFISSSPTISAQPVGGTVRAGTNVTLIVGASGTSPLFYQWYKYTQFIAGATASQLALTNLQAAASGTYFVTVTNSFGIVSSQNAVL